MYLEITISCKDIYTVKQFMSELNFSIIKSPSLKFLGTTYCVGEVLSKCSHFLHRNSLYFIEL